ncbi:MAG: NAD(P)/FAD-dependent oxidoreductase [Candidatus Helarchaeota archaeon]
MDFDVVIIGAGPAGSTTAKTLAERGVKVLLIEKQKTPGHYIHCAGGIIGYLLNRFGLISLLSKNNVIKSKIRALKFMNLDGDYAIFSMNRTIGYTLDRSLFDNTLAMLAVDKGTTLKTNARFIDIEKNNKNSITIKIKEKNNIKFIQTEILVGADGIKSSVALKAGFKRSSDMLGFGYCFDFKKVSNIDPETIEVIFSYLTPGGYTWCFPKGPDSVNFGCGGLGNNFYYKTVFNYFIKKINSISNKFRNSVKVKFTGGAVPICSPLKRCVKDRVLLVGDAANQINSTTAEGIRYALICGKMAGLVINYALKNENIDFLIHYDKYWRSILGKEIRLSNVSRKFFFRFDDKDYSSLIKIIKKINFNLIMQGKWLRLLSDLISKNIFRFNLVNTISKRIKKPLYKNDNWIL